MREIYVSTDVETDGPVAGKHSMLSIGSAAFSADKNLLGTFSANLETLPGALPDPKTAAWWTTQPQAWTACRQNVEQPQNAMKRYLEWLKSLTGKPVFVAYPSAFDFPFVYWYLLEFTGENPFGYSAIRLFGYSAIRLSTLRPMQWRYCANPIGPAVNSRCQALGSTRFHIRTLHWTMLSSRDACFATC